MSSRPRPRAFARDQTVPAGPPGQADLSAASRRSSTSPTPAQRGAGTTSARRSRRPRLHAPRSGAPTRTVGQPPAPRRPGARDRREAALGRGADAEGAAEYRLLAPRRARGLGPRRRAAGPRRRRPAALARRHVGHHRAEAAEAELERRAAQQAAVARLGEHALEGASTSDLMHEAVARRRRAARRSRSPRCSSCCPATRRSCSAPASACPTIAGAASRPASRSQAGYASRSSGPVVVTDWEHRGSLRALAGAHPTSAPAAA